MPERGETKSALNLMVSNAALAWLLDAEVEGQGMPQ
jgi:hypothetical protein